MPLRFFIWVVLLWTVPSSLAYGWEPGGGRQAALGLGSATGTDLWSFANNQAGVALFGKGGVGLYAASPYLLQGTMQSDLVAAYPTRFGTLGASYSRKGDKLFNEYKVGFGFARKFGPKVAAGLQFDNVGISLAENYGHKSVFTFEAGLVVKVNPQITFGVHTFNPVNVRLGETSDDRLASVLNTGFSYTFSDKVILLAEAFKQSGFDTEFRMGAEYNLLKNLHVRAGITTKPFRYTFGFGYDYKEFSLDVASSVHEQLGYSPMVSLQYAFGK